MNDVDAAYAEGARAFATSEPARKQEVGEFTQTMLLELRTMAVGARCTYLAYLLELALIEASDLAAGRRPASFHAGHGAAQRHADVAEIARRILAVTA